MTDLVTVEQLARMLDRSVRSIYDSRYRGGDLPTAMLLSNRLYFLRDDVTEWIELNHAHALALEADRHLAVELSLSRPGQSNTRQRDSKAQSRDNTSPRTPHPWSRVMPNPKAQLSTTFPFSTGDWRVS